MTTPILGTPQATSSKMTNFVRQVNPVAPDYAVTYLAIGSQYGVRGDIAFAQVVLETDYLRFTGNVRADQNNFAGIGAIGSGTRGASFPTPEAGIEAHIQHLYAYATTAPLLPGKTLSRFPLFHGYKGKRTRLGRPIRQMGNRPHLRQQDSANFSVHSKYNGIKSIR